MKRTIITSTLLTFAVAGFAQQSPERKAPTPEQVARREANSLSEHLSLTEDQRSKAYSVYLDRAKDMQKEREARRKEMERQHSRALSRAKQDSERITKFLNDDQRKKYQQFTEQRQRNGRGSFDRRGMRRPDNRQAFRNDFRRNNFRRPGAEGFGFQRGPQRQSSGPGFQSRPDLRNQFRGPGASDPRFQMNRSPRNFGARPDRFQNRPDRADGRRDSLQRYNRQAPQTAPESTPSPSTEQK